jgi:hypothetical protein
MLTDMIYGTLQRRSGVNDSLAVILVSLCFCSTGEQALPPLSRGLLDSKARQQALMQTRSGH